MNWSLTFFTFLTWTWNLNPLFYLIKKSPSGASGHVLPYLVQGKALAWAFQSLRLSPTIVGESPFSLKPREGRLLLKYINKLIALWMKLWQSGFLTLKTFELFKSFALLFHCFYRSLFYFSINFISFSLHKITRVTDFWTLDLRTSTHCSLFTDHCKLFYWDLIHFLSWFLPGKDCQNLPSWGV